MTRRCNGNESTQPFPARAKPPQTDHITASSTTYNVGVVVPVEGQLQGGCALLQKRHAQRLAQRAALA